MNQIMHNLILATVLRTEMVTNKKS